MWVLGLAIIAASAGMLGPALAMVLDDESATTAKTSTSTTTLTITSWNTHTTIKTQSAIESSEATGVGAASLGKPTSPDLSTLATSSLSLGATTSLAHVKPVSDEMADGGKEYVLQGCFAHGPDDDISTILGQNYTTSQAGDMSLSLCLKLCAADYAYVGVADGSSCYCGTTLNTLASQGSVTDCTKPCAGSITEACGGQGYMSVYKLMTPVTTTQSAGTSTSLASTHTAAATDTSNTHGSGAAYTENKDTDMSGRKSPGIIAAIAVGSVAGVGLLLFLIFVAAKSCIRRRRSPTVGAAKAQKARFGLTQSPSTTSIETTSATVNTNDAASIRDAMRVDLRRLDGVVMDQHTPSQRFSFVDRSSEAHVGVAAATGAQWKTNNGASPLTPRTPRQVDVIKDAIEARPSTPTIVVHPPEKIAPNYGLGERAWHRRRLSMPIGSPIIAADSVAETVDDRRALPSQVHGGAAVGPKESLPLEGEEVVVSAMSDEAGLVESPSWEWTLSTTTGNEEQESGQYSGVGY